MSNLSEAKKRIKECLKTKSNELNLSKLGITNLEDIPELFECTHLECLDLEENNISYISSLEKLRGLKNLSVGQNYISDISVLEKLTGLQTLWLGFNQISDFSCIKDLTELQTLEIGGMRISDFSFLKNLTKLEYLHLASCHISDINFLEKLTQLESLFLWSNEISDISVLENLIKLRRLELDNNQISDISVLENLTQLKTADLRENKIKEIPYSIFKLKMGVNADNEGSSGLFLYGNPIESPPMEIIKQGRESVLNWFEAAKKKLNEIKIIFIGEPKAGKTSLLKRLKDNTFNKNEVQTDGVNIEDIAFGRCDTFKEQKALHNITGHFWDFGGQEIMNATHQFFLTKRSIYVLVLDARKDANNSSQIRNWAMRVRATGGDSPIIVLANQSDLNPGFGFENERELQNEFPQIKSFIKISCKNDENIDRFKEKLAEIIPTAELFHTKIDERWITVKNKLQEETKQKYYLNETRFLEICNEAKLTERHEQKNAIGFLHDLGQVLHFDDLNLSEYYVLNPYWITYGAYQILTSKYAGERKGNISMDKLEYIINQEEDKKESYQPANYKKILYSSNERRFLIDILHEFKLCFRTSDGSHFIIPDLLDTTEPSTLTDQIRNSDKPIQFVYEYDYLPKSVMPNLMVKTHQIMESMWRTGCVLRNDNSKMLVTNYQNRISITVTGEYKKKRESMAIIRNIIDLINDKLSNKPVPLIPLPGTSNGFASYERLLAREKSGKQDFIFDEDMPTEKRFQIPSLLEGIENQKNKTIFIFLASSQELIEDRKEFEIFINRENKELHDKKMGIFIYLVVWEDFIDCMSKNRLQDEYNRAIVSADIFVSLFWTKAGKYTKEEFSTAFGHFKENNKPLVYTFFKNAPLNPKDIIQDDIDSLLGFKQEVRNLGHYITNYENIHDLKYQFKMQLSKLIK